MVKKLLDKAKKAQQFAIDDLKIRAELNDTNGVLDISNSAYLRMKISIDEINKYLEKQTHETELTIRKKAMNEALNNNFIVRTGFGSEAPQLITQNGLDDLAAFAVYFYELGLGEKK